MTQHAFTVDVEDYFQVSAFEQEISRAHWDDYPSRVVDSTRTILELLARHDVQATFYILGWVARRHPELVREIDAAGHEIGSHSYWHRLIYQQTPEEFRRDLRQSREVLEDQIGKRVSNFRAPSFSIVNRSRWAIDVLIEEGFDVDSSIFPVHHDRYGMPGARRDIHTRDGSTGSICEFPPTVLRLAGYNLPVGGGGYFRLYPQRFTHWCLDQLDRAGTPFMFYIHPWEVDPEQPRVEAGSRLSRMRHYVNLNATADKLDALLARYQFTTVRSVLEQSAVGISSEGVPQSDPVTG